jgi:hypothetical protein
LSETRDTVNIWLKLREATKFAADTRRARKEVDEFGNSTKKAGDKSKKASKDVKLFDAVIRQLAIAGLIGGLTLLTQGAGVAGLAVVALAGSIGAMGGAIGAIPALAVLAGQSLVAMLLPLVGIKQALGGLNEGIDAKKFAALTKPAQNFVLVLDALKPRVRALSAAIGKGLFPGLTKGLLSAAPAMDALKGPLAGTGRVLGTFAAHLGALVGSSGFLADLKSQAAFNNTQLGRLGQSALHLVNAFRNLMVGARGLVTWAVKGALAWATWADRASTAGRKTGGMQEGFHTVQVTISRVWRLLLALGMSLWNIGRVGKRSLGDGILVYLLRAAQALQRWTSSARGTQTMTRLFQQAGNALRQVRDFIRDMVTAAGPGAGAALLSLAGAVGSLLTSGGGPAVLGAYVTALGSLADAVTWLAQNVPGASFAMSAFGAVLLLDKFTKISAVAKALMLWGKAAFVAAVGTEAGATAFWALNAALDANPVVLITVGIIALGVAFYLAYTKVGWFHRAVQNVWGWIRKHWKLIGAILLGPLTPVIAALVLIIKHWKQIKGFLGGAVHLAGKVLGVINPFAEGGVVNTPLQLVGERGPEIAALPIGSRVFTAPQSARMLRAPRVATVRRTGGGSGLGDGGGDIHIHSTHVLKVGSRVLARAVSDEVAKQKGRA